MAGPFRSRAALQTRIRRVPERPTPKLTGRAEASRDAFRGEAIRKDQTEPGDAGMELHAIFTKTPRGITEVKTRAAKLPRNLLSILALVDGKSTLDRLLRESKLAETKFCQAISRLEEEGFIKVFAAGPGVEDTPAPVSRPRRLRRSASKVSMSSISPPSPAPRSRRRLTRDPITLPDSGCLTPPHRLRRPHRQWHRPAPPRSPRRGVSPRKH